MDVCQRGVVLCRQVPQRKIHSTHFVAKHAFEAKHVYMEILDCKLDI